MPGIPRFGIAITNHYTSISKEELTIIMTSTTNNGCWTKWHNNNRFFTLNLKVKGKNFRKKHANANANVLHNMRSYMISITVINSEWRM